MGDVRGDFLGPPHSTTPAAVIGKDNNCNDTKTSKNPMGAKENEP